ncbi:phosphatase [Paratractidigestivibacter sp.]|uniref:Ppx/GppA phosphatase family protein n=1 Tax=Paratractidigestivibacter sp. TaxID=2847316 RepID=UPI002ABD1AA7|nr:phosphatase [Paratractidigestivibacter sp.]
MRRVACIDIGTVTARLAVADEEGERVSRLAKTSTICNLGQDVDRTRRLATDAMQRVFACCREYVASAGAAGAEGICCTMTSAARDAENSAELVAALRSLGLEPEVIPGKVEGALTFLGVAQNFGGKRILVADNGGGSTELACGVLRDGVLDLGFVESTNVGCRRITDKFLSGDEPPSKADLAAAHEFAASLFETAIERGGLRASGAAGNAGADDNAPERLVVCGGTVTTLVALDLALEPYDSSRVHLATLSREKVAELEALLASKTVEERAAMAGIQPKRAPVILGGAVAIDELLAQTGFEELTVSESDLLFGLSLAAATALPGTEGEKSPVGWKPTMRPVAKVG